MEPFNVDSHKYACDFLISFMPKTRSHISNRLYTIYHIDYGDEHETSSGDQTAIWDMVATPVKVDKPYYSLLYMLCIQQRYQKDYGYWVNMTTLSKGYTLPSRTMKIKPWQVPWVGQRLSEKSLTNTLDLLGILPQDKVLIKATKGKVIDRT